MKSRKLISAAAALGMAVSSFAGLVAANAEDTETVYNFSELTDESYSKSGASVFEGALTLTGTDDATPQTVSAAVLSPLGQTVNVTSALLAKQLAVELHLDAGETVVEYYCGTDSRASSGKDIDMLVKNEAGETVATEANTEKSGVKPYVISYKAETEGDYTISAPESGINRTMVYAVAKTTGEYTAPSGDITPAPATQDPNATPAPTATPRPTVNPNGVADINITRAQGWLETAYITWTNPTPVDYYNVYVKPEGGEYTQIDNELIRYYGSYYRADALGLKAGKYQMKIEPVIGGSAQEAKESDVMEVLPQIREGFAFDKTSPHYHSDGIGAYNNDGTLKGGAQVIYLTDANKDTVTANVVTNNKGTVTECKGLAAILSAREKGYADNTPLCIRMIGQVESPAGKNESGYMQIKGTKNVTFEGVGDDACTYHWSFLIRAAENVEVRNLAVMEFYDDGISLDTNNFNCWVHNCDIFYGQNRGGDQKKGDGSLDVKTGSDYCTFSYNHFWDSGKSLLCGMEKDSYQGYHMTYHHNWFDHSDSRHPRVRGDQVHIYNNYYDGNSKYGAGACMGGSLFVEKNVFRNVTHPVLISMQGTDAKGVDEKGKGTFSGEDGGNIKMYDNEISEDCGALIYASETNKNDYDAYLAKTRDEKVPEDYVAKKGGSKYSNFDTADEMYSYTPTDTDKVVENVEKYAGRVENGDFVYDFDDAVDDASYDRNPVLSKLLEDYKTALNIEYVTGTEYPGTGGEQPTPRPTDDPKESEQPTAKPTDDPKESEKPSDDTCVKIVVTYNDDGTPAKVVITEGVAISEAVPSRDGNTRTMYWDSITGMKPVTAPQQQ